MTTNILSPHWRGLRATPINPDATPLKVAEAPIFADCEGCMFIGQSSSVCRRVSEISIAAGRLDCESPLPNGRSLIYVPDPRDPQQLDIFKLENES